MTHYGVNPSFCSWALGRLPLFSDPVRRGKQFEVFRLDGTPTGEASPLGSDGWPLVDGRRHGVRLFGDMGGTMPEIEHDGVSAIDGVPTFELRVKPGESASFSWKGGPPPVKLRLKPKFGAWHLPSMEAIAWLGGVALRTLDWSMANKKTDWSKSRVLLTDPLQGTDRGMAVELQCEAANLLKCTLWWNAPARYALSVAEYEGRLENLLRAIKTAVRRPPILEYGNELWNEGFPVHGWLKTVYPPNLTWHQAAADEITVLRRVADRVFGANGPLGQRPYYLFVGGHIGTPDTLDRILGSLDFKPDACGPAFYVKPLRADGDRWQQTGEIPTEDQLVDSMLANLPALEAKLRQHAEIRVKHGVPYLGVYECGQSLISNGRPWKKTAIAVQSSPRMGDVYREIRTILERNGVDLANWYSAASDQSPGSSSVDPFGLLESTDLTKVLPKARAARGD